MRYIEGLITESEEQRLVAFIEGLPLGLDFARSGPDRIGKSKPFAQTRNRIRLGFQRIAALFDHLVCCEQQFTGLRRWEVYWPEEVGMSVTYYVGVPFIQLRRAAGIRERAPGR